MNMSGDEFTKLFQYMTKRFDKIDIELASKANNDDLQRVLGLLDKISKDIEISEDERLVISHQLTQIHDWVEKAAKKIDLESAH